MNTYLLLKTLHIFSSVLLVGTGFGSAFYLFFANRSKDLAAIAVVSRLVVIADWSFTTPTIIFQPLSGIAMLHLAGWSLFTPWIMWSIGLYVFAGVCWLPVVWLQIQMKRMADIAYAEKTELPMRYWKFSKAWELLGYPAFISMGLIYFLMVYKPSL